jgi:hypothetical protein
LRLPVLIFPVNARQAVGRRERDGRQGKDAATILAEEQKGVFRVLDIGRPGPPRTFREAGDEVTAVNPRSCFLPQVLPNIDQPPDFQMLLLILQNGGGGYEHP